MTGPFWGQIDSYIRFTGGDQCKNNLFKKRHLKRPPLEEFLPSSLLFLEFDMRHWDPHQEPIFLQCMTSVLCFPGMLHSSPPSL